MAYSPGPSADGPSWEQPDLSILAGGRRAAPVCDVNLLGPRWAEWVLRGAEATCAAPDYVAVALLAVCGAVIGNARWPLVGAAWEEPPILWAGIVGSPSVAKSPPLAFVRSQLREIEDRMGAGHDDALRAHAALVRVASAAKTRWEQEADASIKDGRDPPAMPPLAIAPPPPVKGRIVVMDSTVEALTALSAGLPRGYLLFRDELAGWFASFGRYGGGGTDRAFAIESYGGRPWSANRVKHPNGQDVPNLTIGVLGAIQPERLTEAIAGADDGLAARFLWTWPDQVPPFRIARDPVPADMAPAALARLAALPMGTDARGKPEPVRVRLSREAEDLLEDFGRAVMSAGDGTAGLMASAFGKARGHALRIACNLHYLWWSSEEGKDEPAVIGADAVAAACDLVGDYFIPMAQRVFGDAVLPKPDRLAMVLARHLRDTGEPGFNARDVRRKVGGPLRDAADMDLACTELEEAGLIRPAASAQTGRGRRPKAFDVNPALAGGRRDGVA